ELVPPGSRLVVVAPHPDDEILGAGGLLAAAARAGREILLAAVTDGRASHPGSGKWPEAELAAQRRRESAEALEVLGAGAAAVRRLSFPDGGVAARTAALTTALAGLLMASDVVVSPWRFDGHPDHEATGYATALAARGRGARHLEAPVWACTWARSWRSASGPRSAASPVSSSPIRPPGPGRCCRRGRWPGSGTAARCSSASSAGWRAQGRYERCLPSSFPRRSFVAPHRSSGNQRRGAALAGRLRRRPARSGPAGLASRQQAMAAAATT